MATGQPSAPFGVLLRRYRRAAGLSQEALAERARLSSQSVSGMERGLTQWPYRDTVALLAEALDLPDPDRRALEAAARRPPRTGRRSSDSRTQIARDSSTTQPASAAQRRIDSLPEPVTEIVGRTGDMAALCTLLRPEQEGAPHGRLVTLTGPGGVGKTRLALAAAHAVHPSFCHGAVFVSLAALTDPALVLSTVADALDLRDPAGSSTTRRDLVHTELRGQETLLVLDNFEHLLAAALDVAALLVACPRVTILVTSRAVLRLSGEHEYAVLPLVVPARDVVALEDLARVDAVRLFVARAQAVHAGFALTSSSAAAVAEICRRLDGLPLAIELAAARLRVVSPAVLLARLEHRLPLLSGGARDLPARQQTLRATIAWSYDLLAPAGQRVFRALAVFAGGCPLPAVEAVCSRGDTRAAGQQAIGSLLDTLEGLLEASLLRRIEGEDDAGRYIMLETIREYAREQLEAHAEDEDVGRAHAAYYWALAEQAEAQVHGPQQAQWLGRLEEEHDNLRAALRWAQQSNMPILGLQLATSLWRFWEMHGHLSEGRAWLEGLLALSTAQEISTEVRTARANALNAAGGLALYQGDDVRAMTFHAESLALRRELGDTQGIARSLGNLGVLAAHQGDYARSQDLLSESLAIFRELGHVWGAAISLHNLGDLAYQLGDYAHSQTLLAESLELRRALGDQGGIAYCLHNLGNVACVHGDMARATTFFQESLTLFRELEDSKGQAYCLEGLASVAAAPGGTRHAQQRAARLCAAAATLRVTIGAPLAPSERTDHERVVTGARATLGETAFSVAWAEGQAMTAEQAMAYAAEEPPLAHG